MNMARPKCLKTYGLLGRLAGAALLSLAAASAGAATTELADQPIFNAVNVPGNVALTLSVEYPTATSIANGIVAYSSSTIYLGYFDPTLCYQYNQVSTKTTSPTYGSYFSTYSAANSDHSCTGAAANSLWSGNFLNWASHSTIDPFRWALTGGYRSVDTSTMTILEKAWSGSQASSSESPAQTTGLSTYVTPFTNWTQITTTIYHLGQYMCMGGTGVTVSSGVLTGVSQGGAAGYSNSSTNWSGTLSHATEYSSGMSYSANQVYCVEVRVQVCNPSAHGGLEVGITGHPFCTLYPNGNYKPTGLIQQNAMTMRFAAFGYLLDAGTNGNIGARDGGVMRARMKYLGPVKPVPSSASITNPNAEWNASTGVFTANPDPTDLTNTLNAAGCSGGNCTINNSGVVNYINMFGEHGRSSGNTTNYKGLDNVSELYYTALRYYKELGDVPEYSALNGYNTDLSGHSQCTSNPDQCADGFPVIAGTNWYIPDSAEPRSYKFPVQYECQKNFVIGIGDANTHQDENLPGSYSGGAYLSAGNGSGYEPPLETLVSSTGGVACVTPSTTACSDTTVDATTTTNWIGNQEGTINGHSVSSTGQLGQTALQSYLGCCGGASFYIAGLAYDAHVKDMLPNVFQGSGGAKKYTQTLTTYWVDVLEYGTYYNQNQYWMAAKYGGFQVPSGYTEFCSPSGSTCTATTAWPTSIWASLGRTVANGSTSYTVPDNYYSGRDSASMVAGLTSAFAQIAASTTNNGSTGLSITTSKVNTTTNTNYSAAYNPSDWTGDVQANNLSFTSNGTPVIGSNIWTAQAQLATQLGTLGANYATGRKIVTWNDASTSAVAFSCTNLSTTELQDLLPAATDCTTANSSGVTGNMVVNYLRGDQSNEGSNGSAVFRTRDWVLGDIVDSQVVPVGAPMGSISEMYNPGYSAFQTTYANRKTVVYVGANDGMLHAIDGSITGSTGGNELWAYVPGDTYGGSSLPETPSVNGLVTRTNKVFTHINFVDSTPVVTDVDFNNIHSAGGSAGSTSDWHSVLIGGLGKGGRSYYAIDVTNPAVMTSESAIAGKVLWEFNQSTITNCPSTICGGSTATIGYSFGLPVVTKTKKYGWTVILSSGYDNADGIGYFFLVNPKTGALFEAPISTNTGSPSSPSGLAQVTTFVPNYADGTSDAIYAGDLFGNVWRVDLTTTTGSYAAPTQIITATDSLGAGQPITTWPLVQVSAESAKRYVVFGTGKTLASSDLSNSQVNSIYSVYDGVGTFGGFLTSATLPAAQTYPVGISQLTAVSSLITGLPSTIATGKAMGWYVNLAAAAGQYSAEQVDVQPGADLGIAVFGINVSGGTVCDPSGFGRVDAFDIEKGTTALVDATSGNAVATDTLAYRIIAVSTVNIGGSSLAGMISTSAPVSASSGSGSGTGGTGGGTSLCTASGSICNANVNFNPSTNPTSLNWREIKGGN
jgi:type IV pilus assembly protein PilY1